MSQRYDLFTRLQKNYSIVKCRKNLKTGHGMHGKVSVLIVTRKVEVGSAQSAYAADTACKEVFPARDIAGLLVHPFKQSALLII